MKSRVISGVVGATFLVVALYFNKSFPFLINVLMSFASCLCVNEFLGARSLDKNLFIWIPCISFAVLMPIIVSTEHRYLLIVLYIIVMYLFAMMLHDKVSTTNIFVTILTTVIIVMGLSSMIAICDMDNRQHSGFYITVSLLIPWGADIGAYFIGSFFGKHKLAPKISPKKTVEGFIGGFIFGVIAVLIDVLIFENFIFSNGERINYIPLIVISLVGGGISVVGDLTFSLLKRASNVKDYGTILPGHGGMLDRLDSVIFTTPVLFVFLHYFQILV